MHKRCTIWFWHRACNRYGKLLVKTVRVTCYVSARPAPACGRQRRRSSANLAQHVWPRMLHSLCRPLSKCCPEALASRWMRHEEIIVAVRLALRWCDITILPHLTGAFSTCACLSAETAQLGGDDSKMKAAASFPPWLVHWYARELNFARRCNGIKNKNNRTFEPSTPHPKP